MTLQIFEACAPDKTTAEDGEVLREHVDRAAADRAEAGDDAIAQKLLLLHFEIAATMGHELIEFDKAARIQKQLHALPRGELSRPHVASRHDRRRRPVRLGFRALPAPSVSRDMT